MEMIKRFGWFLLQKPWRAGLIAFLLSATPIFGIPFLSWIADVIIAFVTLRNGWRDGFIILGFSVLTPLIFGVTLDDGLIIVQQVLTGSLAIFVFALLLRHQASWRRVVEVAAWVGVGVVVLVHVFAGNVDAWWYKQINQAFVSMGRFADMNPKTAQPIIDAELAMLVPIATGLSIAWLLMVSLINLGIARWWQAMLFNPLGLRPELLSIRLGWSVVAGFCAALLAGTFFTATGWDYLMPFLAALVVSGLSMIHYFFDIRPSKSKWRLIVFYGVLILMSPYVLGFIVLVALNDSVLDLRKRLVKKEG